MTDHRKEPIRILFVEDLQTDVELAKREISKEDIHFTYALVDNEEAFREKLISFDPDIVISDYSMPSFDGMSALMITRKQDQHIPFIVLTGSMNEETAVSCMKAGANDYVIKEQIKRLPFALIEAIDNHTSRLEKLKIERELKISEERFRLLFNNVPNIAIQGCNQDGSIHYWNSACEKLFGYSELEAIGKNVFDLIVPEKIRPEVKNAIKNAYEKEQLPAPEELFLVRKNDSQIHVLANLALVKLFGETTEIYATVIDLIERDNMIQELISAKEQAEKSDKLKSAFLMNMSHEIRTPMNGILGFTNLLKKPKLSGEQKEKYIEIIQSSGERMLNTLNDIIEISRIESGEIISNYSDITIKDQLNELCKFFGIEAKGKNITISCFNESDDYKLTTDKTKFNSILTNLIKNAIKYTNEGSVVTGVEKCDGYYLFYVKDTGIGIPKERQAAIFNRFEQADIEDKQARQGSGLGLAIARSYVEMLGGKIWVESEESKGTTFYFTLPVSVNISASELNY